MRGRGNRVARSTAQGTGRRVRTLETHARRLLRVGTARRCPPGPGGPGSSGRSGGRVSRPRWSSARGPSTLRIETEIQIVNPASDHTRARRPEHDRASLVGELRLVGLALTSIPRGWSPRCCFWSSDPQDARRKTSWVAPRGGVRRRARIRLVRYDVATRGPRYPVPRPFAARGEERDGARDWREDP